VIAKRGNETDETNILVGVRSLPVNTEMKAGTLKATFGPLMMKD
jgi:hypothetical protein